MNPKPTTLKITTFIIAIGIAALFGASSFAAPITAMSCVSESTKSFVTIGISTELFPPAAPMRILAYDLVVGKLDANGKVASKLEYANESNMKIFDDDGGATDWVAKNVVVVPIADAKHTAGAVLVDVAKKKVTIVDADYETTETLDCLKN